MTPEQIARFWARVDKSGECWIWKGSKSGGGYGIFWYGTKNKILAHRLAYQLQHESIPEGLFICHHCDNPPCVRPDHLFAGTAKDNVWDAIHKSRFTGRPRGIPRSGTFTLADAEEIRVLHSAGVSGIELARRYSVIPATIYNILNGRTWTEDPKIKRLRSLRTRLDQRQARQLKAS